MAQLTPSLTYAALRTPALVVHLSMGHVREKHPVACSGGGMYMHAGQAMWHQTTRVKPQGKLYS